LSRGVLQTVVCLCVWSRNLMNEETLTLTLALARVVPQHQKKCPKSRRPASWSKTKLQEQTKRRQSSDVDPPPSPSPHRSFNTNSLWSTECKPF